MLEERNDWIDIGFRKAVAVVRALKNMIAVQADCQPIVLPDRQAYIVNFERNTDAGKRGQTAGRTILAKLSATRSARRFPASPRPLNKQRGQASEATSVIRRNRNCNAQAGD